MHTEQKDEKVWSNWSLKQQLSDIYWIFRNNMVIFGPCPLVGMWGPFLWLNMLNMPKSASALFIPACKLISCLTNHFYRRLLSSATTDFMDWCSDRTFSANYGRPVEYGRPLYFALWFLLLLLSSSFFPRLISAVADWKSAILPHMVWP